MDNKRAGPKTPGHGKDDRFGRIEEVYHQALETSEDERSAFLAQACSGDDGLRREVEKLLSFDRKAGKFMESPALDVAARALAREAEKSRTLNLAGQTILHYKVQEKIGEGGMGVVYRAEDTNLRRHVAIKILPDEFVDDAERLARFQREAQVLASLHHPNIATLYSLEESDGKRFIVMELVEGESLAQRLSKGPLPLKEALEICRQIAEGLEAAHEKGVIHRDLKPGNVMITGDDEVKVLDFGLAKALPTPGPLASPEDSPTITEAMTRRGVILGTAAYMSPEQAKGKRVDRRADVWALGCILFECLTGKAPFKEETVTETLVKILEAAPDWDLLPTATPRRANELLHRCLEKDPRVRLHDIADVRIEIAQTLSQPPVFPEEIAARRSLRALVSAGVIGGLVVGATAVFIAWYLRPAPSLPVVRSALKIDSGQWLEGWRWVERPS